MQSGRSEGRRLPVGFLTTWWRQQWGSLAFLALLVAVTGGMAMAGVAGARRSASSPTRFEEAARGRDLLVAAPDGEAEPLAALLDGPLVESHVDQIFVFAGPSLAEELFTFAPIGGNGMDIDQGVLLAGRRVDPANRDEIVVTELVADRYDLAPGDVWELVSLSPAQVPELFETGQVPDSTEGPPLPMRVVGVARTTADIAARPDEPAALMLSPTFFDQYQDHVGMGAITHLVRLVDEPDALDRFTDAAAVAYPDGQLSFDVVQAEDAQSDAIGVATVAVLALGLVVALAGVAWIATAAIRQQRLLTPEIDVFRALGLTPSERAGLLVGTVVPGLAAGTVLAPVVAIALSPFFPVGLARRYEPDVGVQADGPVLLLGLVALGLVLTTIVVVAAWRLVGRHDRRLPSRPPRLDRLVGALPPAPAMGVRFALFPPRTIAAPVRPAVAGACLAVIGLAAVAIVGASLDRVVDSPARWGTNWDVALSADENPAADPTPLLDDPDLTAVAFGRFDEQVTINDVETVAVSIEPVRGDIGFTVVEGRAAQAPDEVIVGRATLDRLGAEVGSSVQIGSRSAAPAPFRIVGVAVFPTLQFSFPLDQGAGFDARAGRSLGLGDETRDDAGSPAVLLRWAPGADRTASLSRFTEAGFEVLMPTAPAEVNGLDDVKWFPTIGASFLVVLGGIATSQAIAVTTRRRRRELGVLSVLGFTPGQRRGLVAAQATAIAVVAIGIGIPLGIAAARFVWGAIAGSMGLATDVSVPMLTLLVGGLVVVVALNVLTAIAARSAGRLRMAEALRVE